MKDKDSKSDASASKNTPTKYQSSSLSSGASGARVGTYGVPGYVSTEVIYASQARTNDVIIQRGYALHDPSIKVICKGTGQMDEAANRRIEHEYETLKFLYAKSSAPSNVKDARVSESKTVDLDFGGGGCWWLPLETILYIALQIVEALKLTITAGVIHKDINPDNIVVVSLPEDQLAVQLIDFNLAAINISNDTSTNDSNVLQGTMAYMAPEQTGRLQRNPDFRSDFYSLGITLWEILVGRPPFHFNDVMEYMHAHIAIEIESPSKVDSTIPDTISSIVQKLVKKSPEAHSRQVQKANQIPPSQILTDEQVLKAFEIDGEFEIGTKDCSKTVQIPKGKLYGRSTEQQLLLGHVENALNGASDVTDFVLIVVVSTGNFCVTGAYTEGCLPLQGIVQALQQFVGILLASQTELLDYYVAKIKQSLGAEISRLETVIPDLRLLFNATHSIIWKTKFAAQHTQK
ncbi:kinase-like protein [Rhizoclosmatium globosum]|uniref:Kinase-like protein n=1 Tax=Rhizoclosmatium globosum TaxID=329046 RepID=A0A1Y2BXX5_9FUNG|nr:kinase-like protein [Rhizoclosmatium globosum]|eukprot:ORY39608.1 kinase-like protein [Rhizoclosmatium globosum]